MRKDPEEWKRDKKYLAAQRMLRTLNVVNDHAERGVKLMSDFNNLITNDEIQKQYALQVVAKFRKEK